MKSPFAVDYTDIVEVVAYARSFKHPDTCVTAHTIDGKFTNYGIGFLSRTAEVSARMKRDYNIDEILVWSSALDEIQYHSDSDLRTAHAIIIGR